MMSVRVLARLGSGRDISGGFIGCPVHILARPRPAQSPVESRSHCGQTAVKLRSNRGQTRLAQVRAVALRPALRVPPAAPAVELRSNRGPTVAKSWSSCGHLARQRLAGRAPERLPPCEPARKTSPTPAATVDPVVKRWSNRGQTPQRLPPLCTCLR